MENPEQAFVDYACSCTDKAGGKWYTFKPKHNNLSDTYNPSWKSHPNKNGDSHKEKPESGENAEEGELEVEYFDILPTRNELAYHKYLMSGPNPSIFPRILIITEGCPSNLKISCNIVQGVSNFTRKIKGMHVFVRNFTYVIDFMIVEDISSIIDPRLSQIVLGKPFVKLSNMTHDPPEEVVRFINGTNAIAYKIPHKIEWYKSLLDLEKENTKSVYLRNEKDKRRGVEYVMSKILRFYKECLELGPEYLTGVADEKEVT
nr:retrotransposon Orf1 [Tanacetum cinerariifolium]